MTKNYLENIMPDSFSGKIFAYEGIKNVVTLINGPTGCKFYHSSTSDNQEIRQFEFDPLNYPRLWYFGQPRIPCTYLDKRDYVYGSKDKIKEALKFLGENIQMELLAVINSPGASLIGDDLKGLTEGHMNIPVITEETPGYSEAFCKGYDEAVLNIIKNLARDNKHKEEKTVNVLGLSIHHKYHRGDMAEIEKILELCGVKVNTFIGCNSRVRDMENVLSADLNIVINPEYSMNTVKYLKSRGMKTYLALPIIGFNRTEKFINDICDIYSTDKSDAMEYLERGRAKAYIHMARLNTMTGLPKGTTYSVKGNYSLCLTYVDFLSDYFGMIPESINITDDDVSAYKGDLIIKLAKLNREGALEESIINNPGDLVFADGNTIANLKIDRKRFSGIEIALPSLGYVDVIDKTHIGVKGAMTITEQVINGLLF